MKHNLPLIDPRVRSFSNRSLTEKRQKVEGYIDHMKLSLGITPLSKSVAKLSTACRCSLSQAISVHKLSKMSKPSKKFIQLIDQIQQGDTLFSRLHLMNGSLADREYQFRKGLSYRRSGVSKSVKPPSANPESIEEYRDIKAETVQVDEAALSGVLDNSGKTTSVSTGHNMRKAKRRVWLPSPSTNTTA